MMAKRNYQFTVKLSRADRRRLDETLRRHCQLYNAALQERRDPWKHHRKAINILRRGLETVFGPSGISSAGAAGCSTTGSLEQVRLNPAKLSQHAPQAVTLGSSCT